MKKYILIFVLLFSQTTFAQKLHKEYYENGKLKSVGYYDENGRETGEWKIYHPNGTLHKKGNYHKGKAQGEWKIYYENGQLAAIGSYDNGNETGEWKEYYEDGELIKIENY